jgi:RNA polymerase sigma-70 factor (ECF subfamily)
MAEGVTAGLEVPAREAEFTALYEREYPGIARYMLRRGAGDAAADLAAETFVVVWRQQERWRTLPADERVGWLYGVARKVLANALRSQRSSAALAERIAVADRAGRGGGVLADHSDLTVEQLAVAAAFARLSEADQELIRLTAWDGLSPAQAAEVFGCRTGTLTMRLHRARTRLRKLIDTPARKGSS